MVFLIQQSQNKDSAAVHLKLNELLASHRAANNQLIGIEDASEEDLRRLAAAYLRLASKAADCAESVDALLARLRLEAREVGRAQALAARFLEVRLIDRTDANDRRVIFRAAGSRRVS